MSDGFEKAADPNLRRWCCLHLLTWVLLCCVGASWVVVNTTRYRPSSSTNSIRFSPGLFPTPFTEVSRELTFGFPEDWLTLQERKEWTQTKGAPPSAQVFWLIYKVRSWELSFIILLFLLLVLGTAAATESYSRRSEKWHQYSINSFMAFTVFIALLCIDIRFPIRFPFDLDWWHYICFGFIAFAFWCMFWLAWNLVGRAILLTVKFLREPWP